MHDTFGGFARYFKKKTFFIDNTTFQLHYKVSILKQILHPKFLPGF